MPKIEEVLDDGEVVHTKEGIAIGRGDNKRVIDPAQVELIARSHASFKELAEYFGVKEQTFRDNFREIVTKARSNTKVRLRQAQIAVALKGNATMLIWLGKQMLGQSDQPGTGHDELLPWIDGVDDNLGVDHYADE